jgi:hypothetical protein
MPYPQGNGKNRIKIKNHRDPSAHGLDSLEPECQLLARGKHPMIALLLENEVITRLAVGET